MVTKVAAQTNVDSKPGVIGPAEGGVAWVKVWAAFGVFYGALFFYLMARWVLSGPEPTSPGPDPLPIGMAIAVWAQIVLGFIAAPVIVYVFLIRPWRREGRLTFDGMMLIGCFLCFWQDTYVDAIQPWSMYNAPGTTSSLTLVLRRGIIRTAVGWSNHCCGPRQSTSMLCSGSRFSSLS